MNACTNPANPAPAEWLSARNLSVVAYVLFVLFATLVAGVIFPLQPLDSAWQLRMAGALINGSPFPLVGLGLLQLALQFDPSDRLLRRRWRRCSRLAVIAALGFLLLLPLQGVASFKQSRSFSSAQSSLISGAERKLILLRQAVASAGNNAELNQQLQRLDGPVLGPADLAQPLPLLKAQVSAVLDQANNQIAAERQRVPPVNPWTQLPDLLRNAIACLALMIGFAALAVRPGSERSLLQECQGGWSGLSRSLRQQSPLRRTATTSTEDYLRELSRKDD